MYKKPLIISICVVVLLVTGSLTNVVGIKDSPLDGRIVFAPLTSGTTYMINEAGEVTYTWESNYFPGLSVYWLPGDSIVRSILVPGGGDIGGQGGGVQKISSDGTLQWEFIYANDLNWAHHDICPLPNGNVLILARDFRNVTETINAGRNPYGPSGQNWYNLIGSEHIIEVEPTGPTSGDIVWSWYLWDHLVQEYNQSKQNYGVISDHPELVDINYKRFYGVDWIHANSLDYNQELDQILVSCRNFNEVWVIDHSTTTQESASHSGGRYGKGGDLLYRWGNPQAYDRGTESDREYYWQHDATWVENGYPGAGDILVFNNGVGRGYSSVDEIIPPIDSLGNYILDGEVYGPYSLFWSYTEDNFMAFHLSGAERLPNGNTLILQGEKGDFFVVNSGKEVLWTYDYFVPPPVGVIFYPCFVPNTVSNFPDLDTEGSLQWNRIKPGETVTGAFQVRNIGTGRVNWSINTSSISWGNWNFVPSSGYNYQNITTVEVTLVVPNDANSNFEGYIQVQNNDNPMDFEQVPVILTTATIIIPIAFESSIQSSTPKSIFYIKKTI